MKHLISYVQLALFLLSALFFACANPTISVEEPDVEDTTTVSVTGVTLDASFATLTIGETTQLAETVTPDDATDNSVTWSSDNTAVATVSTKGLVTAVSVGSATITVTTVDGNFTTTCSVTVSIPVSGLSLNKSVTTIQTGNTETLTALITPNDATNQNVTWESDNESVAKVDTNGVVTAVAEGTVTITATSADGGYSDSCDITVSDTNVPVTGIDLNKASTTIDKGATETLVATFTPAGATNQIISWSSDNSSIASVNAAGVVTAVGGGTATITVTTYDGGKTATCVVTVNVPVSGVSLNKSSTTLSGVGATETLVPVITPADATNTGVSWSSSAPGIVTVSNGTITAVSTGSATITVTTDDGGETADCDVTVIVPVTGITISDSEETLSDDGDFYDLDFTITPAEASIKTASWSSSDPSVATVDADGGVSAVGIGTTIITVTSTDGGKTDTCTITVADLTAPGIDFSMIQTSTEVLISFDEPLDETSAETAANYVLSNQVGNSASVSVATLSGQNTVILTLSEALDPADSFDLSVSNVEDAAGNVMVSYTTIGDDPLTYYPAPEALDTDMLFDESGNTLGAEDTAVDLTTYSYDQLMVYVLPEGDLDNAVAYAPVNNDGSITQFLDMTGLAPAVFTPGNSYDFYVAYTPDPTAPPLALSTPVTWTYTILDSSSLELGDCVFLSETQMIVSFSEEVDSTTAETIGNYIISNQSGNSASVTLASLQSDNITVILTLSETMDNGDSFDITVSNVEDLSGNVMATEVETGLTFFTQPDPLDSSKLVDGPGNTLTATSGAIDLSVYPYDDMIVYVMLTGDAVGQDSVVAVGSVGSDGSIIAFTVFMDTPVYTFTSNTSYDFIVAYSPSGPPTAMSSTVSWTYP